jgi:16S rRNA (cytidine1402-2'-O)-methyltransferase
MLTDLAAVLGPRDAAIARELTKHFETVRRGSLPDLAAALTQEAPPKGEIVVLVGPPGAEGPVETQDQIDLKLGKALETLSVKDAAAVVSAETGQPRRKVYARAIELLARER